MQRASQQRQAGLVKTLSEIQRDCWRRIEIQTSNHDQADLRAAGRHCRSRGIRIVAKTRADTFVDTPHVEGTLGGYLNHLVGNRLVDTFARYCRDTWHP